MLKIYLTDLGAYNAGALVGKWIELPMEEDELSSEIKAILSQGEQAVDGYNHEEWFITDFEWEEVSVCDVGEYTNVYQLNQQLRELESVTDRELKAVAFLLDEGICTEIEDALTKVDDVIIYENQTMSEIAYDFLHDYYDIDTLPFVLTAHIDYDAVGRDMMISGGYYDVSDGIVEYIG